MLFQGSLYSMFFWCLKNNEILVAFCSKPCLFWSFRWDYCLFCSISTFSPNELMRPPNELRPKSCNFIRFQGFSEISCFFMNFVSFNEILVVFCSKSFLFGSFWWDLCLFCSISMFSPNELMRPPNELRPKSCPCVGHSTCSAEWTHGFRRMGSCAEWTQFAPNELSSCRFRPPNDLSCRWMSSCVRRMDSVCVEWAQFLPETGQFFVRRMSSVGLRLILAGDVLHFTPNGLKIFRRMSSFRKRRETSGNFRKLPETSGNLRKSPGNLRKPPETSRNLWKTFGKHPETSPGAALTILKKRGLQNIVLNGH